MAQYPEYGKLTYSDLQNNDVHRIADKDKIEDMKCVDDYNHSWRIARLWKNKEAEENRSTIAIKEAAKRKADEEKKEK
ncbi:hypothetical protein HYV11_00160 [Candidatus Dependentiae bacterium]|nr:hypothetical protein [Candidatus Dependentiae bacterium]